MAEIKDKLLLTYKHLRCKPEDRIRKRGIYGLTYAINTRKIGGFLLLFVVCIYAQRVNVLLRPGSWISSSSCCQANSENS
tara:strand:- start:200 stop:439 length:240 start_codon:yes stop_codon:yes gene_type:complete